MPVLTTKPEEIASFRDWLHAQYTQASTYRAQALQRMRTAEGHDFQDAAADFQLYNQHADQVHWAIRLLASYTASLVPSASPEATAPADGKRSAAAGEGATAPVLASPPLGKHGEISSPAHA